MASRYRKEVIDDKTRYIPDPNGQELWQIRGYKSKPGRAPNPNRRIRINMLLKRDMVEWLREQPEGITATIEAAIRKEMEK